ncbi:hypothetical protein [Actinopolyspora mortivallis]|nr:hypothetical protein [Actinopolyspora mortivallis]
MSRNQFAAVLLGGSLRELDVPSVTLHGTVSRTVLNNVLIVW